MSAQVFLQERPVLRRVQQLGSDLRDVPSVPRPQRFAHPTPSRESTTACWVCRESCEEVKRDLSPPPPPLPTLSSLLGIFGVQGYQGWGGSAGEVCCRFHGEVKPCEEEDRSEAQRLVFGEGSQYMKLPTSGSRQSFDRLTTPRNVQCRTRAPLYFLTTAPYEDRTHDTCSILKVSQLRCGVGGMGGGGGNGGAGSSLGVSFGRCSHDLRGCAQEPIHKAAHFQQVLQDVVAASIQYATQNCGHLSRTEARLERLKKTNQSL